MTPPTNRPLLRNMESLHDAVGRGDPIAKASLDALRAKAASGDLASLAAVNTFKVLGFQKQYPAEWTEAGIMHEKLASGDPHAEAWLHAVKTSAVAGVEKAFTTLDMLSAQNDKHYASAWARPNDGEAEDDNTRTRNLTPMTLAHRHPRRRAYAVGNLIIGADPTPNASKKKFLKLTPAAEQQLIKMMLLGATARVAPDSMAPALANVVPVTLPPFEAPICARARDAVARNSPAASALVAQCNAASGRQVLAPVAAPQAAPAGSALSLGRTQGAPLHLGRVQASHMSSADFKGQSICDRAADAKARNSPVFPQLATACAAARANSVRQGLFIADALPVDSGYLFAVTAAGNSVIASNSKMAQFRDSLPNASRRQGFTMAMGARAGQVDPKFVTFMTPALAPDPELLKGFVDAMNM